MKPGSADTKSIYWKTFSILVGKHFHLLLRKNVLSSISYLLYWLGICSSQNYICCGGYYDMVVVLLWVVVVLVILEVAMISVFHKAFSDGDDIGGDEAGDICDKYDIDDHGDISCDDGGEDCDDIGFH